MHSLYVNDLLECSYADGGRYAPNLDCWGLVRVVFFRIHGVRLPMLDNVNAASVRDKTLAHRDMLDNLHETQPTGGAIAAIMSGNLCTHVGIAISVDGNLYVLEITPCSGVRTLTLNEFEAEYGRVKYYAYG